MEEWKRFCHFNWRHGQAAVSHITTTRWHHTPQNQSIPEQKDHQKAKDVLRSHPSKTACGGDFVMTVDGVFLLIYTEVMRQCSKQIFKSCIKQQLHTRALPHKQTHGSDSENPFTALSFPPDVTRTGSRLELSVCVPQTHILSGTRDSTARCVRCITL